MHFVIGQMNCMTEMNKIYVEVIYALPEEQHIISLHVDGGTTIEQAIRLSGVLEHYPDIDLAKTNKFGIFGKIAKSDRILKEGDRIEIYRPLIADPKEVRRKRASEGKLTKKGAAEKNS